MQTCVQINPATRTDWSGWLKADGPPFEIERNVPVSQYDRVLMKKQSTIAFDGSLDLSYAVMIGRAKFRTGIQEVGRVAKLLAVRMGAYFLQPVYSVAALSLSLSGSLSSTLPVWPAVCQSGPRWSRASTIFRVACGYLA